MVRINRGVGHNAAFVLTRLEDGSRAALPTRQPRFCLFGINQSQTNPPTLESIDH